MKIKKILTLGVVSVMAIASLTGCNTTASGEGATGKDSTVKIGASFALTGEVAQYGIAASNGAKLAIEEYNANGGVLDKQIEFLIEDNKGSQVDASNAFRKLVDSNKVVAFIGSDISSTTETIANLAAEKKIPMITPTGTKLGITSIGDNIFRTCYIDPTQGELLAQFAQEDLSAKTAAIMINNESDYSVGIAEAFKEVFKANGGTIATEVNYSEADKDFKPFLTNIKNANPDVVVIPDYYETIALIAAQAREIGITATLIGGDGWDGVTTQTANNPESIEGSYFINHYTPEDDSQIVQDFITHYTDKYKEAPNAFAALGYDTVKILIEAMKSAGTTESDQVVAAVQNTSIDGVTGHITFNEERNPIKSVAVIEIKQGENTLYKKLDPK